MADDPRRFDHLDTVVKNTRKALDDHAAVVLHRMGSHIHPGMATPATVSTRPSSPAVGTLIYETDVELFAYYSGTAWVEFASSGDSSTLHEAEYVANSTQNASSSVDTPISFGTSNYTTADVTQGTATAVANANAKFTLNRGGLWTIDGGLRVGGVVSGSSYGIWVGPDGSTPASLTRYAADFNGQGGTNACEFTVSFTRRFSAGATVVMYYWQNQGSASATANFNSSNHIRLTWLRS